MRTGLVAKKMGMTQIFEKTGAQVPVTILKVDETIVLGQRTVEKDGYEALRLGVEKVSASKLNKPQQQDFAKAKKEPRRIIKEFRVTSDNMIEVGVELKADHFQESQYVDVTGTSIGKGFAGSMKRHNFGGLRATHGVSISHRSHGSTGNRQDPGKVFKNKKMAGHMGARRVTKMNLKVYKIDADKGLIYIHGSVPGSKNSTVFVRDAVKKTLKK